MAAGLIARAGGSAEAARRETDEALAKVPVVSGGGASAAPALDGETIRLLDQAEQIAQKAGDSYVTVERMLLALDPVEDRRRQGADRRRPQARGAQRRDQRIARRPHRRHPERRGPLRRAQEVRARPHPGRARRQARSGHRPRRGDPPHRPDPRPPDQEQSGADRRSRRRQDRDRRRARAAHRQWRRARQPQGPPADVARHGQPDRRRQISRRVRGAAEGRARRGQGRRGRGHPVHRRDAHAGRRRRRAKARWTPPTC